MKKLYTIILFLIFVLHCGAQSPVITIENFDGNAIKGAYYKDSNNLLDPFVGTYIYTSGSNSLKLVLLKKAMSYDGYRYEDLLIGEYQYIENGVEKINTISNLNTSFTGHHSIEGNDILLSGDYLCQGCFVNEKRILGSILEQSTHNYGQIIIKLVSDGQPAIKASIRWRLQTFYNATQPAPLEPSFISDDYLLVKQ
jgi:hypothetical protein